MPLKGRCQVCEIIHLRFADSECLVGLSGAADLRKSRLAAFRKAGSILKLLEAFFE